MLRTHRAAEQRLEEELQARHEERGGEGAPLERERVAVVLRQDELVVDRQTRRQEVLRRRRDRWVRMLALPQCLDLSGRCSRGRERGEAAGLTHSAIKTITRNTRPHGNGAPGPPSASVGSLA